MTIKERAEILTDMIQSHSLIQERIEDALLEQTRITCDLCYKAAYDAGSADKHALFADVLQAILDVYEQVKKDLMD